LDPDARGVGAFGEAALIERISGILPSTSPPEIILGVGDDCAVVKIDRERALVATGDILVEDVHFRFEHISAYELGRRAAAVNLSDIAAMGARPTVALVSCAMPDDFPVDRFDDIIRGIRDQLADNEAHVVGGNLARTPDGLTLDIFMLGEVRLKRMLTRSGAAAGDRILVTGHLGDSKGGLMILEKYKRSYPDRFEKLVRAHLQPAPRIEAGRLIAASGFATAMIDISDSLAIDLLHVCRASDVGAEIELERIPVGDELAEAAVFLGAESREMALYGGEDYQLLFTVKPDTPRAILADISRGSDTRITEIGTIIASGDGCRLVDTDGGRRPLEPDGWDHF